MKRSRVRRGKDKHVFNSTANQTKKINLPAANVTRGGRRL